MVNYISIICCVSFIFMSHDTLFIYYFTSKVFSLSMTVQKMNLSMKQITATLIDSLITNISILKKFKSELVF